MDLAPPPPPPFLSSDMKPPDIIKHVTIDPSIQVKTEFKFEIVFGNDLICFPLHDIVLDCRLNLRPWMFPPHWKNYKESFRVLDVRTGKMIKGYEKLIKKKYSKNSVLKWDENSFLSVETDFPFCQVSYFTVIEPYVSEIKIPKVLMTLDKDSPYNEIEALRLSKISNNDLYSIISRRGFYIISFSRNELLKIIPITPLRTESYSIIASLKYKNCFYHSIAWGPTESFRICCYNFDSCEIVKSYNVHYKRVNHTLVYLTREESKEIIVAGVRFDRQHSMFYFYDTTQDPSSSFYLRQKIKVRINLDLPLILDEDYFLVSGFLGRVDTGKIIKGFYMKDTLEKKILDMKAWNGPRDGLCHTKKLILFRRDVENKQVLIARQTGNVVQLIRLGGFEFLKEEQNSMRNRGVDQNKLMMKDVKERVSFLFESENIFEKCRIVCLKNRSVRIPIVCSITM